MDAIVESVMSSFDTDGDDTMDFKDFTKLVRSCCTVAGASTWPGNCLQLAPAPTTQCMHAPGGRRELDCLGRLCLQMQDSMLLDGKLQEYQRAFQAVDTSGNGTLGATAQLWQRGDHKSYMHCYVIRGCCVASCADGGT